MHSPSILRPVVDKAGIMLSSVTSNTRTFSAKANCEKLKTKEQERTSLFLLAEVAEVGARQSDACNEKEAGQSDAWLSSRPSGLGGWVNYKKLRGSQRSTALRCSAAPGEACITSSFQKTLSTKHTNSRLAFSAKANCEKLKTKELEDFALFTRSCC